MTGLSREAAREQRRAADPAASAWVSASAGSGKTKVLVDRLLNLLLAGAAPYRLLCLTYTKTAAAEMSIRLSDRLSAWVILPDGKLLAELEDLLGGPPAPEQVARARQLFARVLDAPGGLHIQTLHSFAQSLLARFPLEAGVAPHFTVMDERDQAQLLDEALKDVLAQARLESGGELARALELVTSLAYEDRFGLLMKELVAARSRLTRLFASKGGAEGVINDTRAHLGLEAHETAGGVLQAACGDDCFDGPSLRQCLPVLAAGGKGDQEKARLMAPWLAAAPKERMETFDAYAQALLTQKLEPRSAENHDNIVTQAVKAAMPGIKEILLAEQARLLGVYEKLRAVTVAESTAALLTLAWKVLERYRQLKDLRARLDYDDLIQAARRLIREGTAWVLYKLDGGIDHVLIDEAQDTSPDQWDIVNSLADEFFAGESARPQPRTLFAVGDVKQSIYSFQGADPDGFEAMRGNLAKKVPQGGGRWEAVDLVMSFRSTRAVLEAVDAVFADGEAQEGLGDYARHLAFREKAGGSAELWPPLEPIVAGDPAPWRPPVEPLRIKPTQARMAALIARRIRHMVDNERLESRDRPVAPGDILVLVRRRTGFVSDLVRELKRLDVPVAGVDRLVVTDQIAVADLMALARFALLPQDDLNLACVLKGPFLNFSEEQLFDACFERKTHLWEVLEQKNRPAHDWLAGLLALADRVAPHDFFSHVLGPLGGRKAIAGRLGHEALDAVDELMNLALDYGRRPAPSLTGFLAWMEAGKVEIKRESDPQGGGVVRVMTVHGAKGLQSPIVFLPDTLTAPQGRNLLEWSAPDDSGLPLWAPQAADRSAAVKRAADVRAQRQKRESHRLLYVAMTRAEDRLIICGWQPGRKAEGAWYPLVRQGFERIHAEQVDDPWLAGDAESPGGKIWRLTCRQEEEVKKSEKEKAVTARAILPDWALAPAPAEPMPGRPLFPSRPEGEERPPISPLNGDSGLRFQRGRLIHRLLQTLPDLAPSDRPAAAGRYLAHAAAHWPEEGRRALVQEVLAVLSSGPAAPLFGPLSRAEAPLVGLIEGRVLSGQVDRLAEVEGEIWVADFKTNRPIPGHVREVPEIYRRQMALYRTAASRLWPGRRIRTFLLWTDGPSLMEI